MLASTLSSLTAITSMPPPQVVPPRQSTSSARQKDHCRRYVLYSSTFEARDQEKHSGLVVGYVLFCDAGSAGLWRYVCLASLPAFEAGSF